MGSRLARKIATVYATLGGARLAAWLVRRTLLTVYARRSELLIVKRLDGRAPASPDDGGLRIRRITGADAALLTRFIERFRTKRKAAAARAYLTNRYDGFLAFVGDEPVGYWWWVGHAVDRRHTHPCVARFGLTLAEGEIFAFDYFIAPAHRANGMAVKFLSAIYAELRRLDCRAVWGSVDADNAAARWVYNVLGNKVVRRVEGRELLSWLIVQDRRVFVRNSRWNRTHPFEHRALYGV